MCACLSVVHACIITYVYTDIPWYSVRSTVDPEARVRAVWHRVARSYRFISISLGCSFTVGRIKCIIEFRGKNNGARKPNQIQTHALRHIKTHNHKQPTKNCKKNTRRLHAAVCQKLHKKRTQTDTNKLINEQTDREHNAPGCNGSTSSSGGDYMLLAHATSYTRTARGNTYAAPYAAQPHAPTHPSSYWLNSAAELAFRVDASRPGTVVCCVACRKICTRIRARQAVR